jgi:hypothetical protein
MAESKENKADQLLLEAQAACSEAVRRYRTPDMTEEDFLHCAPGWLLWLNEVSDKISVYLRESRDN